VTEKEVEAAEEKISKGRSLKKRKLNEQNPQIWNQTAGECC
jgi:hypothetical protein